MNPDELSDSIKDAGNEAMQRAQNGVSVVSARVQEGYNTAKERVQEGLSTAKEKAQQGLDRAQEGFETVRGKSADAVQTGVRYVRANPVPVIAGALVAGVVLGYLFMRRDARDVSFRERYNVDDRLDGVGGWLKDRLTPVAEAAQRHVRTAGDALDDARQRVSELDVSQYIDPLVERTKKATSRFSFWQ